MQTIRRLIGLPAGFGRAGVRNAWLLLVLVAGPLALTAVVVIRSDSQWTTPFRDIAAVADVHPLTGAMSTLGLLFWAAAAAIWLCAALAARRMAGQPARSYAAAALLSAYLAIDDAFQLHEKLLPLFFGVKERPLLLVIAFAGLAFGIGARAMLLRTPLLFIACLALLPVSVVLDNSRVGSSILSGEDRAVLEDAAKWAGIVGWFMCALWHYAALPSRWPCAESD